MTIAVTIVFISLALCSLVVKCCEQRNFATDQSQQTVTHNIARSSIPTRLAGIQGTALSEWKEQPSSAALADVHRLTTHTLPQAEQGAVAELTAEEEPAFILKKLQEQGRIIGGHTYYVGPQRSAPMDEILREAELGPGRAGSLDRAARDELGRGARHARPAGRGRTTSWPRSPAAAGRGTRAASRAFPPARRCGRAGRAGDACHQRPG